MSGPRQPTPRKKPRKKRQPGTFGTVEKLPAGRYRARYRGPDGHRYPAPTLFLTQRDARGWLSLRQSEIIRGIWMPPGTAERPKPRLPFETYATRWLADRDLKTRTREHYEMILEVHLVPAFGAMPLTAITADDIRAWHAKFGTDTPTMRAHCYRLLNTIMSTAASDGKIPANPCVIRGAGTAHRVRKIRPASPAEIETITAAMPAQYQAMVLLAAWCALRFGELTELRRRDIEISETKLESYGVIRVERAVVRSRETGFETTTPKSAAGIRDVEIPPHLLPALKNHLTRFVGPGPNELLFGAPRGSGHLAAPSLYRHFYKARAAANRDDLRFHDLRHSGAVLAAQSGATLAELMGRLGHSSPGAALRYQHAAAGRDREIAARLSKIADNRGRS